MKNHLRKAIRFDASGIRPPNSAGLRRLERASRRAVDTSDIPEIPRLRRHGAIWQAIADAMQQQGLTGHGLWKRARHFCPRIPESAVYEFLADKRSVGVEYADAMLLALGIRLLATPKRRVG